MTHPAATQELATAAREVWRLAIGGVVLVLFLALGGCGRSEETGPAPGSRAGPQVKVRLAHTGTVAAQAAGRDLGSWSLGQQDAQASQALAGLSEALAQVTSPAELRELDGSSEVRLVVEADAQVPWRHLQWVLVTVARPVIRIWRITFVEPGGRRTLDVDLPKDRSGPPRTGIPGHCLVLKFFRKGTDAGEAPFTRVRPAVQRVELDEEYEEVFEVELEEDAPTGPSEDRGAPAPAPSPAIDFPPSGPTEESWTQVRALLSAGLATQEERIGEIVAPPPTGGDVPYSDIFAGMWLLHDLQARRIYLEGAALPLPAPPAGAR